mmetsp:Transcript_4960/g.5573  ORF Transcript_4960/g.5573 Transcript_4960/m.5573 type:complete len:718 (+) Transcript_4960:61-2214(+)
MENKSKPFIDNQAAATFLDHYTKSSSKSFYDKRRSQLKNICFFLYVLLPVFQTPFWITNDTVQDFLDENAADADGGYGDSDSIVAPRDYSFAMDADMYLSRVTYCIVSLVLIVFIILGLIFKPQYTEGDKTNFHRWLVLPIMILSFLELLAFGIFYNWQPYFSTFATPIAFLLNSSYLRALTFRSCRLIAAARRMLVYLVVIIVFFAWIGRIQFGQGTDNEQFSSLGQSIFTMLGLLSGAHFPAVMSGSFAENKGVFAFYLIYLILGVYFVLALLLAVFYQAYKRIKGELRKAKKEESYASIKKSWDQLVGYDDGMIDRKTALKFFRSTRRNKSKANILKIMKMPLVENDERIFSLVDKNDKNALERGDYIKFCNMITLVNNLPDKDANSQYLQQSAYFRGVTALATSWIFESFMLLICFGNLVVLSVEQQREWQDNWWIYLQLALSGLYFIEITIMLLAGADKFLSSVNNIIELFLTVYSLFLLLDNYFNSIHPDTVSTHDALYAGVEFVKYAILIRMFRFFKIVLRSEEWRVIYRCILTLVPTIITFFLSIIALYYVFALAGILLFGGQIFEGDGEPSYTDAENHYDVTSKQWDNALDFNYNDFPNALISLFIFLFHPWNASAVVAMNQRDYSIWFFIAFYLLGVLMAVNIILPIVVHTFMTEYKRKEDLSRAREVAKRHNLKPVEFVGKNNPYTAPELDVLVESQMNGKEGISS